ALHHFRCTPKVIWNGVAAALAGFHGALDDGIDILPVLVREQLAQVARRPVLTTCFIHLPDGVEGTDPRCWRCRHPYITPIITYIWGNNYRVGLAIPQQYTMWPARYGRNFSALPLSSYDLDGAVFLLFVPLPQVVQPVPIYSCAVGVLI